MDVREKLVELIDETIELYPSEREELADGLIAHGVTVQEWISVDERLPDENEYVMIWDGKWQIAKIEKGITERERTLIMAKLFGQNVTHWMPLPHPPKGE